jgi:oxalate decarboxylase
LEQDQHEASESGEPSPVAFNFAMGKMTPTKRTKSGEVRVVDAQNFPASTTIAAAHVIVKPGGLRELHWHQNADEWQYYVQGKGRMTVFFNGSKARTADFAAGDVGYVPQTLGHYIENTGDTDLIFIEMFKANRYQELSLSQWLAHTPPELVIQHLGISKETLNAIPKGRPDIVPA